MDKINLATVAGLAFALFGIYMLRHALASYRKARASQAWPWVAGQISDVRLWGKRRVDGVLMDAERLAVEYHYSINGSAHTGRAIAFFTLVYPETLTLAQQLRADKNIKVYVNPKDPADAVLITGLRQDKPYSDVILGCLGAAVGLVILTLSLLGILG